jgi:hypothetical protein
MNHEEARRLFMDYLYGEMDSTAKADFEQYLNDHPELRTELNELHETADLLNFMPAEQSEEDLLILPMPEEGQSGRVLPFFSRWNSLAGAAAAMLIFFFGVLAGNVNIATDEGQLAISFGTPETKPEVIEPAEPTFTVGQVEQIITQLQTDQEARMNQLLSTLQADQQQQLQATLTDFADYLNQQRNEDLRLISLGFESLEESTYDKFRRTDEVLGSLIQTVGTER